MEQVRSELADGIHLLLLVGAVLQTVDLDPETGQVGRPTEHRHGVGGDAGHPGQDVEQFGDAVGEPVATRFGKHPYRVPAMRGVVCTRTLEGSAAVFVVSTLAALVAVLTLHAASLTLLPVIGISIVIGIASALCEAISPHGWDNFTLQVVPAALAYAFL